MFSFIFNDLAVARSRLEAVIGLSGLPQDQGSWQELAEIGKRITGMRLIPVGLSVKGYRSENSYSALRLAA